METTTQKKGISVFEQPIDGNNNVPIKYISKKGEINVATIKVKFDGK